MHYKKSPAHFFWHLLAPYKWYYLFVPLAPFALGLGPLLTVYALSLAAEKLMQGATTWEVILPISMILVHQACVIICFSLHFFLLKKIMAGTKARAIKLLYGHVQDYTYSFFGQKPLGELQNQLTALVSSWEKVHGLFTYRILMPSITFLLILGTLTYHDGQLGLLATISTFFFFFVMLYCYLSPERRSLLTKETKELNSMMSYITDIFRQVEILFAFRTHKRELKAIYHQAENRVKPSVSKVYQGDLLRVSLGGFLYLFITVTLLFYIGYRSINGQLSAPSFLKLSLLSLEILRVLWGLTYSTAELTRSWWEINEQLTLLQQKKKEGAIASSTPGTYNKQLPILAIKNIDYQYRNDKKLFKNFSLELGYGEKLGIIGPSGGGKSTLIKLIMGYLRVQKGGLFIAGQPIDKLSEDFLRDIMVLIPQNVGLFNRSLLENIRYGKPSASLAEVVEAAKKAAIHSYISQLPAQYATLAGENGEALSGGEKQRIAIARAILKKPPLLILDEATSALDTATENLVQKALKKLFQTEERSVITIAHRLSTVKNMDRLLVIDQGRIVEEGTHDQLIKQKGVYTKMCNAQMVGASFF